MSDQQTERSFGIDVGCSAEYVGPVRALHGKRCTVDSWTPTFKRVRAIFDLGGYVGRRLVHPANLKRLGGGVIVED